MGGPITMIFLWLCRDCAEIRENKLLKLTYEEGSRGGYVRAGKNLWMFEIFLWVR